MEPKFETRIDIINDCWWIHVLKSICLKMDYHWIISMLPEFTVIVYHCNWTYWSVEHGIWCIYVLINHINIFIFGIQTADTAQTIPFAGTIANDMHCSIANIKSLETNAITIFFYIDLTKQFQCWWEEKYRKIFVFDVQRSIHTWWLFIIC